MASSSITKMPNWLELPNDIIANILLRLDTIDIVTSACLVCSLWWSIFKDPLMWRTIRIVKVAFFCEDFSEFEMIFRYAVEQSRGCLENIVIFHFANDELLKCLAQNASNLRSMQLVACRRTRISEKGFSESVRKLSRLEGLSISQFATCILKDSLDAIGISCPLLISLKFDREMWLYDGSADDDDDEAVVISETMSRLRRLDIKGNRLTNVGLLAILDGCPLLEHLDIRSCYNLNLSECLRKRCLEQIKDIRLPNVNNFEKYRDVDDADFVSYWDLLTFGYEDDDVY